MSFENRCRVRLRKATIAGAIAAMKEVKKEADKRVPVRTGKMKKSIRSGVKLQRGTGEIIGFITTSNYKAIWFEKTGWKSHVVISRASTLYAREHLGRTQRQIRDGRASTPRFGAEVQFFGIRNPNFVVQLMKIDGKKWAIGPFTIPGSPPRPFMMPSVNAKTTRMQVLTLQHFVPAAAACFAGAVMRVGKGTTRKSFWNAPRKSGRKGIAAYVSPGTVAPKKAE